MTQALPLAHFKKTALTVMITAALTACGGGGGGGGSSESGTTSNDPSATTQTASINTGENSQETATVAGTITDIETVRSNPAISVSTTQPATSALAKSQQAPGSTSTIYITISDLNNDGDARYRILHDVNGKPYATTLTIDATNTSATKDVAKAENIASLATDTLLMADEQRLSNILLQLEYLAGITNPAGMDQTQASIQTTVQQAAADTQTLKDAVTKALNDYKAGTIGEGELAQKIAEMDAGLGSVETLGDSMLSNFNTTLSSLVATLPANRPLTYDAAQGRYTRFTDGAMGQYTQAGEWQFDAGYDWLNAALQLKAKQN
ncbi:MAG: hypothetical protein AWU57_323 [Marinobacter sp. T13-3]|nr:MAG: hypothetical protein AWU57_323 [Marinobacter sp. T13-3]